MEKQDVLRLSLIVGVHETGTKDNALRKLILMALFNNGNSELSDEEISILIKKHYNLEFSNSEVSKILYKYDDDFENINELRLKQSSSGKVFSGNSKFKLRANVMTKFQKRDSENNLASLVRKFKKEHKILRDADDIERIIKEFLYGVFNSNKDVILNFLNKAKRKVTQSYAFVSYENRKLINNFLEWDNLEKDKLVYDIITYCVEYCLLTTKISKERLKTLFSNKSFYLDTNMLFHMIGIHDKQRKKNTQRFIAKCRESGIKLKYTNFTEAEINRTISGIVRSLKDFADGKELISIGALKRYKRKEINPDLLELFGDWRNSINKTKSSYGDFEIFLKKQISAELKGMEKSNFSSFHISDKKIFEELHESIMYYKEEKLKYPPSDSSVDTDVNNYLFVSKLRNGYVDSFDNINDYIVSVDGHLCNWNQEFYPGSIPVVVLPSVWHSLLLRITGRTSDDFSSFINFLNVYENGNFTEEEEFMSGIITQIQKMNDPVELKNKVIYYIESDLTQIRSRDQDIDTVIASARENILENMIGKSVESEISDKIVSQANIEATIKSGKYNWMKNIIDYPKKYINIVRVLIVVLLLALSYLNTSDTEGFIKFLIEGNLQTYLLIIEIILILFYIPQLFFKRDEEEYKEIQFKKAVEKYSNIFLK